MYESEVNDMENEKRKELIGQYKERHPDMGVVCFKAGDRIWLDTTTDAEAYFNRLLFQLKLGSWTNREIQKAYSSNPEGCELKIIKKLDYKDLTEDHSDDIEILLMEALDEYPDANPIKTGKKFK